MIAANRLRPCARRVISLAQRQQQRQSSLQLRFKSASTTSTTSATATSASASGTSASAATAAKETKSGMSPVVIAQALVAVGAGALTVSVAAAVVEQTTAASVPVYHPKRERFDASSFGGRFAQMLMACDPRLLLYSKDQVLQAKEFLDRYEQFAQDRTMDRALWEAKRVVSSALHADTGDVIPRPFRMSGFVPCNGPICVAMVSSTSTSTLLFWSWVNQSQNALVNYYNRNASSPMTNEVLAVSYGAAVGSALAVAWGLATLIQKRCPPQQASKLLRWVAFPSAVVASSLNCYIVRSPEIANGVPLCDADGNDVLPGERSNIAAAQGVYSTTASRAILQAPVYFVPPLLVSSVPPIRNFLAKHPQLTIPVTTYLLLTSFGLGLPATVAIFPQQSPIAPDQVEAKFQHLRDASTGKPYEVYYYNKGL